MHAECNVNPVGVFAEPQEFWTSLDEVVAAQEEPFSGPGVFAQWRLMKAIHDAGIKVVLDGQGGDELLCGYAKYFYFLIRDLIGEGRWLNALSTTARAMVNGGPQLLNLSGARRYLPGAWWARRMKARLLQPDFARRHEGRVIEHPAGTVLDQQVMDIFPASFAMKTRTQCGTRLSHGCLSSITGWWSSP